MSRKAWMRNVAVLPLLLAVGCTGPLVSDPDAMDSPVIAAGASEHNRSQKPRRSPIKAGEPVPDLRWFDQTGREISTGELVTAGDALLIFVPGDQSPATRPVYEWVRRYRARAAERGCEVLVVSPDPVERNAVVAKDEELRAAVLADPSAWGARVFGLVPRGTDLAVARPQSVLLGREGVVLETREGLFDAAELITALTVRRGAQDDFRAIDLLKDRK
jgi:peroxiredoxin